MFKLQWESLGSPLNGRSREATSDLLQRLKRRSDNLPRCFGFGRKLYLKKLSDSNKKSKNLILKKVFGCKKFGGQNDRFYAFFTDIQNLRFSLSRDQWPLSFGHLEKTSIVPSIVLKLTSASGASALKCAKLRDCPSQIP